MLLAALGAVCISHGAASPESARAQQEATPCHVSQSSGATPRVWPLCAGWVDCARQSLANEGRDVFFKGLSTTLARAFLVNGAIFSAYELAHKSLL